MAKAGTVALVGRPNAGKSTLANRLLGERLSIVSDKPQTTRHRMVGILSQEEGQIVFYDTPGIHRPMHRMNREMVREAADALGEADIVCLLVDISQPFGKGEAFLLDLVSKAKQPKIALLNKIDLVKKNKLLPILERYGREGIFDAIIPISAETGDGCENLLKELWKMLPEGEPLYDKELLTIHPERFLVAERIREKILRETRNELPFSTAVLIERWEDPGPEKALRIHAALLVEREGQKKILIGHGGEMVKTIGTAARHDLEEFLGRKVFLDLRVRTEEDWRENPRIIADIKRDLHAGTTLDVDDLNDAADAVDDLEQMLDGLDENE
ncbi:MAG: GTPase Era [Thermoanaerobaculia bacterium]|nr:GTPase Era [Thermoanaerobaculia bacterium]MBP9825520.1 GTPase Era [Thermoanaerobaculia bacterium]